MNEFLFYNDELEHLEQLSITKQDEEKSVLDFMYKHIGCSVVEHVYLAHGISAWVDENALMTGNYKHINQIITEDNEESYAKIHHIAGSILFTSVEDGSVAPLSDEQIEYIRNLKIASFTPEEFRKNNNDENEYDDGYLG